MKKKVRKLKTWPIVTFFMVIIFGILLYCIIDMKNSLTSKETSKEIQVLDTMDKYSYSLNENDSKYFKDEFKKLKSILEKKEYDEEEYAKAISKLFLIDFFSLNNVTNKNDIGGVQFVYKSYRNTFIKYAKDTIYKYVENNIYNNRTQELPVVSNVEVTGFKTNSYKSKSGITDENAYYVNLKITYEKDLGYQTISNLIIIHSDEKLEIVSME